MLDVDLSGKELVGENLGGARLSAVDLSEAKLMRAKMQRVELIGVNLRNTIFDGADLTDARIADVSSVAGASFEGTDFSGVAVDAGTKRKLQDCITKDQLKSLTVEGRRSFVQVRRPESSEQHDLAAGNVATGEDVVGVLSRFVRKLFRQ